MALNGFFDTNDPWGHSHFLRRMPDHVDARVLAASTNESVTPPTGAKYVIFSAEAAKVERWAPDFDAALAAEGDAYLTRAERDAAAKAAEEAGA